MANVVVTAEVEIDPSSLDNYDLVREVAKRIRNKNFSINELGIVISALRGHEPFDSSLLEQQLGEVISEARGKYSPIEIMEKLK